MQISKSSVEETTGVTFQLEGRFDAHEADGFRAQIIDHIDEGGCLIRVDLSQVNFLDSAALAVLTSGMKRCREAGGDLQLLRPSDPVRVILELTRLDLAFVIV